MNTLSTAYEQVLDRLRNDGRQIRPVRPNQSLAQCPAHDDRNPSLSITSIEGQTLLYCHAGCHINEILHALQLSPRDLFDDQSGATYLYPDGRTVHRTWDKKFHQSGATTNGHRTTLYRLPQVKAAVAAGRIVWLVEGEKDVHAIEALGEVATTAPMGAKNINKADLTPLHGAIVIAIPDRDEPGTQWAQEVTNSLAGRVQALILRQARTGKDVADHIAAGHELSDLEPYETPEGPPPERSSWWPVDLTDVLDGTWAPPQPTIGLRNDGAGLFYPGRDHAIVSESEAGKTWFACLACIDEMQDGRDVLYVDFEGDAGALVNRLLLMGARRTLVAEKFHYMRPNQQLYVTDLIETLDTHKPSLVVLDGITEGMTMHGFDPLDNKDVALFGQMLAKRIMTHGPAVVSLDHVTKSAEGRGRYAIGGVHKLNGLDGAAYILNNRQPFGDGLTGISTIRIAKDRHGQLRAKGLPGGAEGMYWYGDLVVKVDFGVAEASIHPPQERDENWQPTEIMERISTLLEQKGPLSQRIIVSLVKGGRNETIRDALNYLIADGYVSEKTPHVLLKPYEKTPE